MLSCYRNPPVSSEEEDQSKGGGALRTVKIVSSTSGEVVFVQAKRMLIVEKKSCEAFNSDSIFLLKEASGNIDKQGLTACIKCVISEGCIQVRSDQYNFLKEMYSRCYLTESLSRASKKFKGISKLVICISDASYYTVILYLATKGYPGPLSWKKYHIFTHDKYTIYNSKVELEVSQIV